MDATKIILDALQLKRNILMSDMLNQNKRIERFEEKLAPTVIFGYNISTINRVSSEYYIKQTNLANSEVKILKHKNLQIDTIMTSVSKGYLRQE